LLYIQGFLYFFYDEAVRGKYAGLKPLFMGYPITPALMPGFKKIKPAGLQPKIFKVF
jgi:hypothetical protein